MKSVLLFIGTILSYVGIILSCIPNVVYAETCNSSELKIESIELIQKSALAKEIVKPKIIGKNIVLNLEMSYPGDFAKYNITVYNGTEDDYVIDKSMFINTYDYFDYIFESQDTYVKAGTIRTITLKVEYKNVVPDNKYTNDVFENNNSVPLNLNTSKITENPATGVKNLLYVIPIIVISGVVFLVIVRKNKAFKVMVILMLLVVPVTIYAVCRCELNIESTIKINKCKFRLVTSRGSFSSTEDVKEICVNDATDEEVFEYNEYNNDYQTSKSSLYNNRVIYMDLDYISSSSYIRVYSDSSKTTLLEEYKGEDLYNMYHNKKTSITYLTTFPSWRHVIDLPDGDDIYVETSSDIWDGYNSGVKYVKQLNKVTVKGLWSSSEDVLKTIRDLYESVDSCRVKRKNSTMAINSSLDTGIGTFDNDVPVTFALKDSISECSDYYLVGFTNCDNYNEEDFLEELEDDRYPSSIICTGNTYHAIWVKYNNSYVDSTATIR